MALSENQVQIIRNLKHGDYLTAQIAEIVGISTNTVNAILDKGIEYSPSFSEFSAIYDYEKSLMKKDIIETVENSYKRAMQADSKFQAKHAPTHKAFKPNYKPTHYAAKTAQETAEIVIPDEDMIVGLLVEYVRNGDESDFLANCWFIGYTLSVKPSTVILAYNRHAAYIMERE